MATFSHALSSRRAQSGSILLSLGELTDLIDVACGLLVLGNHFKIQVIHLDGLPGLLLYKVIVYNRGGCILICLDVPRYRDSSRARTHISGHRLGKVAVNL